jgi:hypothetical protein
LFYNAFSGILWRAGTKISQFKIKGRFKLEKIIQ